MKKRVAKATLFSFDIAMSYNDSNGFLVLKPPHFFAKLK
jgi:hypothetical protein